MSDSTSSNDKTTTTTTTSSSSSSLSDFLPSLKTPGVRNIEKAYSRAGATNHHTPGVASTLGSQKQEGGTQERQGVGSKGFEERVSDQRVEPSAIGKMFNNMINGTDGSK